MFLRKLFVSLAAVLLLVIALLSSGGGPAAFAAACSVTVTTSSSKLSIKVINDLLKLHNDARRAINAVSMPLMTWSDTIAKNCEDWLATCPPLNTHSDSRTWRQGKKVLPAPNETLSFYLGENLASSGMAGSENDFTTMAQLWLDEKAYWTYTTATCTTQAPCGACQAGKICGHYTQIIWHSSYQLGCAEKNDCADGAGRFVCQYLGGNMWRQAPYVAASTKPPCEVGLPPVINGQWGPTGCSGCAAAQQPPGPQPPGPPPPPAPTTTTAPPNTVYVTLTNASHAATAVGRTSFAQQLAGLLGTSQANLLVSEGPTAGSVKVEFTTSNSATLVSQSEALSSTQLNSIGADTLSASAPPPPPGGGDGDGGGNGGAIAGGIIGGLLGVALLGGLAYYFLVHSKQQGGGGGAGGAAQGRNTVVNNFENDDLLVSLRQGGQLGAEVHGGQV